MANSINDVSPKIRDFLLHKNLLLADTIVDNKLSGLAVGLGQQAIIGTQQNAIQGTDDIIDLAEEYRNFAISRNRYTSIDDMVSACIVDNSFSYNQTDGGYIDENNKLNIGGPSVEPYNAIGSILNQQGFGLGEGGILNQADIRSSVLGRVLGATGVINDTPIGIIGGQQLLLALAQKDIFNAQRALLGKINLQPFSLLRGGDFIKPDYSITVRPTLGGRVLDTILDLSGFELPLSTIPDGASIFEGEGGFQYDSTARNNTMIKSTGKGQLLRLFELLNKNKYKPLYETSRSKGKIGLQDPEPYNPISDDIGLINKDSLGDEFIWGVNPYNSRDEEIVISNKPDSLLSKTKELFNNNRDLETYFNDFVKYNQNGDELTTPVDFFGGTLTRGSGVINGDFLMGNIPEPTFDENDNPISNPKDRVASRTWTSNLRYDRVSRLQKHSGLIGYKSKIRENIKDSVLDSNGFVKIAPYKSLPNDTSTTDVKKFMFSIENLAWNDNLTKLYEYEKGNGDPTTKTKGRIMWFPPYDIKFTDTTALSWDTSSFIGRGEPIYTYNNTERSGTLAFKIIIDYPDYLNDSKLSTNEIMASLAAGAMNYEDYFSTEESGIIDNKINPLENKPIVKAPSVKTPNNFYFYFPNDSSTLLTDYEKTGGSLTNPTLSDDSTPYTNTSNYGLNDIWDHPNFINDLKDKISENKGFSIKLKGYTSSAGESVRNKILSSARIATIKQWLIDNISSDLTFTKSESFGEEQSNGSGTVDSRSVKTDRAVRVEFTHNPEKDEEITNSTEVPKEKVNTSEEFKTDIKNRFHREDEYFQRLRASDIDSDKIIYKTIREKITFFQPAFHSTTPEGFNSRLTFLQQCTRQGPTNKTNKASNLAFGMPPVCILRIGDFYHTKIIINTLGITYDPLVWDLNPEGVGVQPMIANIEIAFKFIGGSSLNGPINKLQNAVSFNYFANTEIYDLRSDRFIRKDGGLEYLAGLIGITREEVSVLNHEIKPTGVVISDDQIKTSEIENSKTDSERPPETVVDLRSITGIAWSVTYYENNLIFTYNAPLGEPFSQLTGTYIADLKVVDVAFNNKNIYRNVLTLTINKTLVNGAIVTTSNNWNEADYDNYPQGNYKLTITGNGIKPIIEFGI